jgi:hypothetical protein
LKTFFFGGGLKYTADAEKFPFNKTGYVLHLKLYFAEQESNNRNVGSPFFSTACVLFDNKDETNTFLRNVVELLPG